jgi:hypothetical protein
VVQREHVPNAGYISSDDTGVSLPEAIAGPDKPDTCLDRSEMALTEFESTGNISPVELFLFVIDQVSQQLNRTGCRGESSIDSHSYQLKIRR